MSEQQSLAKAATIIPFRISDTICARKRLEAIKVVIEEVLVLETLHRSLLGHLNYGNQGTQKATALDGVFTGVVFEGFLFAEHSNRCASLKLILIKSLCSFHQSHFASSQGNKSIHFCFINRIDTI